MKEADGDVEVVDICTVKEYKLVILFLKICLQHITKLSFFIF